MKQLVWIICVILLAGCGSESPPEPEETYGTAIEVYAAQFNENRGKFLTEYVIDDVHTRWACVQFFCEVGVKTAEQGDHAYRVEGTNGHKYKVKMKIVDRVIEDIRVEEVE